MLSTPSVRFAVSAIAVLAMGSAAHAAVDPNEEIVVFEIAAASADNTARAAVAPAAVRFDAFGHHFDLNLEANGRLVAPGVDATLIDDAGSRHQGLPATWIGRGADGSEARLVIDGGQASGYVSSSDGTFVFEPDVASGAVAGSHVVHRAGDLLAASDPISCAADDQVAPPVATALPTANAAAKAAAGAATSAATTAVAGSSTNSASVGIGSSPLHVLEVSVVVDAALASSRGASTAESVLALFNEVDGIFRSELGVTLQIVQFVVYESASAQPFSATTSSMGLLMEVSAARRNVSLLGAGGVTHLVTGRNLLDAKGIGWVGGACDSYAGASLSELDSSPSYRDAVLMAHELGHNVGALHDGATGTGCEGTPAGFIMWPVLGRSAVSGFSACSEARIAGWVPNAACLASMVPANCGNGVVDAGEECDDGGDSGGCCRSDCSFKTPGLPCGDSGDVCLDAVCDGLGACTNVPNEAPCTASDACVQAQCSEGRCVAGELPRAFDAARALLRVDDLGNVTSARFSGSATLSAMGGDPTVSGLEMHVTVGSVAAWDEFVPAERWVRKGAGKFQYKTTLATAGHLRSAKVRFDTVVGRASFQMDVASPAITTCPGPSTIFLLAGNHVDGQCATAQLASCTARGRSSVCQ